MRILPRLAGVSFAVLVLSAAPALAQSIAPADSNPVATSVPITGIAAPADLYNLSVDWVALGFDSADVAATGPSSSWHDDDHSSSSTLVVGNPTSGCPYAHYPTIQSAVDAAPPGSLIL